MNNFFNVFHRRIIGPSRRIFVALDTTLSSEITTLPIEQMQQLTGNNYSSNFLSLKLFLLLRIWEVMRGIAKDYAPHIAKASNYLLRACDSQACTISRHRNQKVCNMLFNDSLLFYGTTWLLMETDMLWIKLIDALVHVWIDIYTNQQADKKTDGQTPRQTGRQTNKAK